MKSILIINTPESCEKCPLRSYSNLALWCTPLRKTKEEDDVCPLRPMPSKRKSMVEWIDAKVKTHDLTEYDKGWNDCVEFLERGKMSKEIIKLKVNKTDLLKVIEILIHQNGYHYVIVKPSDFNYIVEAHIGEPND